jgi:hypothetical protein
MGRIGRAVNRCKVQGARYKVQGEMLDKVHIIPCTLYPNYWLLATDYLLLTPET